MTTTAAETRVAKGNRRPVNVSLPATLVERAKALGINLSQACEAGLSEQVEREEVRQWKADNREWIESHRRWVEDNPLPFAKYRLF